LGEKEYCFHIAENIRKLIKYPKSKDKIQEESRDLAKCTRCKKYFNKYSMFSAISGERSIRVFYCEICNSDYKGSLCLTKYTWSME